MTVLVIGLLPYLTSTGQVCSSCSAVEQSGVCQHYIECRNDEKCNINEYTTESGLDLVDLGCIAAQACPHSLESVFGKRDKTVFGKRDEGHHYKCMSCCNHTAICNQNMTCAGTAHPGLSLPIAQNSLSRIAKMAHMSSSHSVYHIYQCQSIASLKETKHGQSYKDVSMDLSIFIGIGTRTRKDSVLQMENTGSEMTSFTK